MNTQNTAHSNEDVAAEAEEAGREAVDSTPFAILIAIGLAAYGLVHLLVSWIAFEIAWTGSGSQASGQGAFQAMAGSTVGVVLLWATALGLFLLVVWQVFESSLGHRDSPQGRSRILARVGSGGRAVVYAALGFSAVHTAVGSGSGSGSAGNSEQTWTAQLLSVPLGAALVVAVGVGIGVVAGIMAYQGVTQKFTDRLDGQPPRWVRILGQIGYLTKAAAFGIVAVLVVVAALTHDPEKAGGLDEALRTLREQPLGPALLSAIAVGIACFGAYCFAWARYAKRV